MPKREQIVTPPDSRRSSIRQPTANPCEIFQRVCIFCEKDKNTKNSRTRQDKVQCAAMRADETIRKAAVGKMIKESWMSSLESLWLLKRAIISHAVAVTPEKSLSVVIRKNTARILNIPVQNCRGINT